MTRATVAQTVAQTVANGTGDGATLRLGSYGPPKPLRSTATCYGSAPRTVAQTVADPRTAYRLATAHCLALYVPGHPTEAWRAACAAADAAWKAMRKGDGAAKPQAAPTVPRRAGKQA